MTAIPSVNSAAVLILRQDQPVSAPAGRNNPTGIDILATANSAGNQLVQAEKKIASDLFSVHHVDATQLKVKLIERLGEAFGIKRDDYESQSSYGLAIAKAVSDLKQEIGGFQILTKIEKDLGLDELGISLDTLVNAIINPYGKDNEKLDEALKEFTGEAVEEAQKEAGEALASITFDDIGTYSI